MQTPDALVKFAVHEIVTKINSGLTPQAAAEKVAAELELNHNFIKRAAEAVNVALHHSHFKKHPDRKADDFPIIDAQKVTESIYNKNEKTAGEYRSELFSSFQSPEVSPKFSRYLEAGAHREVYEKLATAQVEKQVTSEQGVYEKSANYIRDLKKTAENKQAEAIEAEYQVNKEFCSILKKFAHDPLYRTSWDEFESQVYSKHGEAANEYLDLLYKTAGTKEQRGEHNSKYTMFNQCKEAEMFDSFLTAVDNMKITKQASEEAADNLNFENSYVKAAYAKRGCELFGEVKEAGDSTILEQLQKEMNKEREKIASIPEEDPVMASIKLKKTASLDKSAEHLKAAIDYIDAAVGAAGGDLLGAKPSISPASNTATDNRDRAFVLQELATTDPILSKMPTHKVVNDYQQLLRIAPELSKEKEVVRSILRQTGASQSLDPFQAQQLIEANSKLFKQHQMQQGQKPVDDKV